MTTGETGNEADAFEPLRERLKAWRERRKPGEHIPEDLWRPAVRLARQHGVSKTSAALRLGYRELKARVEMSVPGASRSRSSREEQFVEVPCGAGLLGSPECLIEVEDRGWRIRIALNGRGTSEVAAVIETVIRRAGR